MISDVIAANFLSPPILFFFLGMAAIFLQVDLRIPKDIAKFFSLYLMFAIGFHGGVKLSSAAFNMTTILPILVAVATTLIIPLYSFFILRRKLNVYDAAAIAATYGSVSVVTFVTATNFLNRLSIPYGGHMVAALALMEAPAIIIGLLFVQLFGNNKSSRNDMGEVLHEAFLNSSTFLILGSLFIGFMTGHEGEAMLAPFTQSAFKGILCFFMLDMGLLAASRIGDLRKSGLFLFACSIGFALVNAALGITLSWLFGFSVGDGYLLAVLCASASYIAVPAAMRMSVPEANPSLYISMALGLTFTFNIIVGLPLYLKVVKLLMG